LYTYILPSDAIMTSYIPIVSQVPQWVR